ncbi:hypothetical protein RND71_007898 [Anisodus tanguticus]|uniref:Uncharacterized protein n=1 Tax=Anisodus tanguticus TaxID=243964 RepID=A0AAE1SMM8_9SOLA|nr:hypothetical protein RND71_007898 [Anisodus tanguticus]
MEIIDQIKGRKIETLGQQVLQVPSKSTLVSGSSPKEMIAYSRMIKEGNNIVEAVERTLAQLNLPQERYYNSNNPFMQEHDDVLNAGYAPIFYQDASQSKIYSIEDLTNNVQEQYAKLFKLTTKMESITKRESSQTHIKIHEVQEK